LELIDIYRIEVAYQIQKNWAFSEQLAGGRTELVAELAFTIMPSGEIKDIWFDKRSGNMYLDESAQKAILKSNPVSPHPPGIVKPFIIVGLRFTPKGVGKTVLN
jgi:colicin import membrane protein